MNNQGLSPVEAQSPHTHPSWRTEPEIDTERQTFLTERLAITPDIQRGIYPFKDVKLTRADIEWFLVTHEGGRGPVNWSDVQQRGPIGLDLRGTDLRRVNLCNLPLTRMRSELSRNEWNLTTLEQRHMAGVHLQGADLSETHLEGAILQGAHLEGATLRGTYHGRGFLPGPFALGDPVTALAALEAVVGIFIEISFIATFTQRFFGR